VRRDLSEKRFQVQWNRRARMVLTSGQNTPVVDSSGDRNHSLFAKYFISVLRQNSSVMSGEMLSYELASRMQPEAARMGLKQTPTYTSLQDAHHDYGDFFFLPAPTLTICQKKKGMKRDESEECEGARSRPGGRGRASLWSRGPGAGVVDICKQPRQQCHQERAGGRQRRPADVQLSNFPGQGIHVETGGTLLRNRRGRSVPALQ
jgi:hypothetical protein